MIALVTGGAGFIGAHVTQHLLNDSYRVIVLDDLSGGFEDNVDKRATFINGSVEDHALLSELFEKYSIDYIFHLAAYAAEGLSHFIRRYNYSNNLIGSVNLINEAVKHKVKCFVFTSSIAVYGDQQPPVTEEMSPTPIDPYGVAKYAVEMDLQCAHELFGLNYVIFRPHNVYGKLQNIADHHRNVVGIFMNQLMRGLDLTVFGDGKQTRAFTHVDDVAPIIARSITIPKAFNQVFNIGSSHRLSINTLAEMIMEVMNSKAKLLHLPQRHEVVHAYAEHLKAKRVFGFESKVDLKMGLQDMAKWAQSTGPKESQKFELLEIDRSFTRLASSK